MLAGVPVGGVTHTDVGPSKQRPPMSVDAWIGGCASCGKNVVGMSTCAGCKVAKYCSSSCQKKDWKAGHKNQCVVS